MKSKYCLGLLFFGLVSIYCHGQRLKIEPYTFVSKAKDTLQAELGTFKVLENRENGKDSIPLSFIRFKSTNSNPGSPIVYLAGGPGGSGISTAKGKRFELFIKLREIADVIAFDQRGTGMSHRLPNCDSRVEFDFAKPIDKAEYLQKTKDNCIKCLEFWKRNKVGLAAYNTTENARDIDELRKALNSDKISLWGISYGSHLAFEYIRLFEEHIDKAVLASLEGPDHTIKLPTSTEQFIFHITEKAKDNYGSSTKYPNLKNKILAVHQKLKESPQVVTYENRRGKTVTVGVSNFELQATIAAFYLKNPWDSKRLPKVYNELYEGDFSQIAPQVMMMKRFMMMPPRPMPFAMDMQSGISEARMKIVEEQIDRTILGSTINFFLYEWMMGLDVPKLPKEFRTMKKNNVNTLLLSGTMDGRTYVSSGKEIAKDFTKGYHVIVENGGHDLYMQSPLVVALVLDFFKGKEIEVEKLSLDPVLFE
ncbi:alpha/beta hydrolase fold [Aquimarina spongiae]|uniref:Alpha/beta hydrolase fold n=2 Tax=Aquimarina spongiae TaxID=570521 RepID=A0A1M6JUA1_9FLAO|nr:alpha/beta hydrolase fold [Aquimarina spongiae]